MESKSKPVKAKKVVTAKVKSSVTEVIEVPEVTSNSFFSNLKSNLVSNRRSIFKVSLWVVIFVVTFALVDLFVQYQNNDASIAVINGERIYKDEFYTILEDYNLDAVLQGIILEKSIYQEAAKENITVTDAEVDEYMKKFFEDQVGGKDQFKAVLEQSGKNYNLFKRDMKVQIIEIKKFPYSEDDLRAYFDQNKASFKNAETDPDPVYTDVKLSVEYSYITNVIANDKGSKWITDIQAKNSVQDNLTAKPSYELFGQTRKLINGLINRTQSN